MIMSKSNKKTKKAAASTPQAIPHDPVGEVMNRAYTILNNEKMVELTLVYNNTGYAGFKVIYEAANGVDGCYAEGLSVDTRQGEVSKWNSMKVLAQDPEQSCGGALELYDKFDLPASK
jgi:hypothetical protein